MSALVQHLWSRILETARNAAQVWLGAATHTASRLAASTMRGQWPRALLLLALLQPSLQGKLLKAALAAVGSGGFRLLPMFLPIPVEERLYYPVHYFLPVPYEERLHTHRNLHKVHHHHKMLIPVHRRTHKVVHKPNGRAYGKKHRRNFY